jgi:hypothetical protein
MCIEKEGEREGKKRPDRKRERKRERAGKIEKREQLNCEE